MNLFNVLEKRMTDLGVSDELIKFYNALYAKKDDQHIKEIIKNCDTNYFYINFEPSQSTNKYDVGKLIISFDDESRIHEVTYIIHLSYTSCKDTYLPKVLIERNELLKAFIHSEELNIK